MGAGFGSFRRVVLFGIDGGGTFFEQASTPFADRIFEGGAISRKTLTEIPTVSAECWGAMLHGVDRHDHQLTNWTVSVQKYPDDSPYPSVFRVIREAMPDAKLAAFSDWKPINDGIIERGIGVHKFSDRDFGLIRPALDYINENDFTLLFFQFDSVDGAGHRFGYGSTEHLASITTTDMYIRYITDAIKARGWEDDTLFLMEADHGGTPNGSHGCASDGEKYVRFCAAGKGICACELQDMQVRDTSAVILHALGIQQPRGWTGRVPGGMFEDVPENLPRPQGMPRPQLVSDHPHIEEKGELLSAFAALDPKVYLPFDEGVEALASGLEQHGKFYRIPGVAGNGMRFDDGWMAVDCPALEDGMTFMTWARVNSLEKPVYLMSSRRPDNTLADTGVHIQLQMYFNILLSARDGKAHEPMGGLPESIIGEWIHYIVSIDLKARRVKVWINFRECIDHELPEGAEFDLNAKKIYIAQDATEQYPYHIPATLDDFCVFGKAATDADVERICAYYKG